MEVAPALINAKDPLYSVEDVFNGILVEGNMLGMSMYYGSGAGKLPTASAVVGDMIAAVLAGRQPKPFGWSRERMTVHAAGELRRRYFARFEGSREQKRDDVRETFGQVKWIVLEGQDEFAVLTGEMTEAEFMASAEKVAGLRQKIVVRT